MQTTNSDGEEELTPVFENYKKQQLEPVKGYSSFSYTVKKTKLRKKSKKSSNPEAPKTPTHDNVVEPLPMEFLEELEKFESRSPAKESKNKKRKKKKIVVTSSVVDDSYIPLEAGCTTSFSLARLDKCETLSSAATALQFYSKHLYGKRIARVSADKIIANGMKVEARKLLAKRRNR
ncbi:uncharacterized protein LOC111055903 [Nilaparvata lugens]|uniref:uncharacterized protein LOC111055903 n=1 Tax=Nilaparvata lugens TaxID=108931 RepID=UPI000B980325|nr:uncharacterized protein LOC111055903 [Nilaparvata lugens]XP_039283334.1 uncharacterized protein LOC111055903 [Nilaparvata lugens]